MEDIVLETTIVKILDICERIEHTRSALAKLDYDVDVILLHDVESLLQMRLYALIDELTILKRRVGIPFTPKSPIHEIYYLIEPLFNYLQELNDSQKYRHKILADYNEDIQKMYPKWWASPEHKFRFTPSELEPNYHPNKNELGIFSFVGLINLAIKHKYNELYQQHKTKFSKALYDHFYNHFSTDELNSTDGAFDEFESRYRQSKMNFVSISPRRRSKLE